MAPLDADAGASGASAPPVETPPAPVTVGPYTLLRLIGEGGLGSVYLAAQERPIRRRVAIKIIKRGMETRQLIARFEVERQALALMDHPGIARVFDAGATDAGVPYFAMEFIDGPPITRYCDEKQLTVVQRLGLFVQVCSAVQHAHQKGVIHRDIKPSNVLIAIDDDKPAPKIIDFGIAKAAESASTGHGTLTGDQQMVGTPMYMSPEQVIATRGGVDTRSDIYSLGVLLYELLTGATPFDYGTLDSTLPWEMQRVICEVQPPLPSHRVTVLDRQKEAAANRGTDPAKLRRLLRGELDWVVMKAIAKDRERRYGNASSMGADVTRYLQYEPVHAGPPGLRYRARRFIRRNKLPLVVAASLVIGLGATTEGLVRAVRAERAEALEKSAAIDELWNARLLQARAGRWGGKPGQRLDGLRAITAAARIRPALALRNEAIGCMALADVEPTGLDWEVQRGDPMPIRFDRSLDRYLAQDTQGKVAIYRTADHKQLIALPSESGAIGHYASFSPDGRYLAATYLSGAFSFRVWDLEQRRVVLPLREPPASEVAIDFIGQGASIAVCEARGNIAIYQLPSGSRSATIACTTPLVRLKAQPQGRLLAAWGDDRQLRIFSVQTGTAVSTFQLPFAELTNVIAWHPDGRRIGFYANGPLNPGDAPNRMYIIDSLNGERLSVMQGHLSNPQEMFFSPDAQVISSGAWDGTLRLWGGTSGKLLLTTSEYGGLLQTSADGRRLAAGGNLNFHVLRSALSRECRHLGGIPSDGEFRSGDFSADGAVLACASNYGVRSWDVESGLQTTFTPAVGLRTVLFSPDGNGLLVSNRQGIRRIMPAPGTEQTTERGLVIAPAGTGALALSRDGRKVVYGLGDGSIWARTWPIFTQHPDSEVRPALRDSSPSVPTDRGRQAARATSWSSRYGT